MAFKMKGSAFKLGNVATKSALKDIKWHNTNPKDRNDKSREEAQAHNSKHTTGEDSEHAAPTKMKSPMKQEVVTTTEPVEETKEVVEEKVNPHGDPMRSVEANTWKQINTGDISENWKNLQEQLARSEKHGYNTEGLKKTMLEVQKAMERRKLPLI